MAHLKVELTTNTIKVPSGIFCSRVYEPVESKKQNSGSYIGNPNLKSITESRGNMNYIIKDSKQVIQ
jgi:hypothetical protein